MSPPRPAPLIVPFKEFPDAHKMLWRKGMTEYDHYGSKPYGARLAPDTVHYAGHGWGRFVATCPEHERSLPPAELAIPRAIRRFVTAMKEAGIRDNTIATRLWEVRTALGIMCPGEDFSWLTSPDGNAVRALFPSERRTITIYHPRLTYEWGLRLMDQASQIKSRKRRAAQVPGRVADRGALLARAASSYPRDDLPPHPTHPARGPVPSRIPQGGPQTETVLTGIRPAREPHQIHRALSGARAAGAAGRAGSRLALGRGTRYPATEKRHLGHDPPANRQAFRRGVRAAAVSPRSGYDCTNGNPTRPGAVAAMLDHTQAVSEKAYNIGRQQEAAKKMHDNLSKERRRLEGIALRAFGRADRPQSRNAQ